MTRVMCARVAEIIIAKGVLRGALPVRKQEQPARVAVVLLDTFPECSSAVAEFKGQCIKFAEIEYTVDVTPGLYQYLDFFPIYGS